jgi:TonB family protein
MPFVPLALIVHILLGGAGAYLLPYFMPDMPDGPVPLSMVILEPPPEEVEDEPEEPPIPDGQIVEVAPPQEEVKPEESDYLSKYDITVEEETKSDLTKVNPEVVAPTYSREEKLQQEEAVDLNVEDPSTGAQVGNETFDPSTDGNLAALPSPYALTNRDGLQAPVPAAHMASDIRGAPQNDLLEERSADEVALRTKKYLYAGYLERIRRMVNFYWEQNIDNLPTSVRLIKSAYTTTVNVVLDGQGSLEILEVTEGSGNEPLDEAVVRAFHLAAPFPNPPEGLIEKDGRVYLPRFEFTVRRGVAKVRYQGVDPRSGVLFPGLHKSPY